jgi:hypothetical protein
MRREIGEIYSRNKNVGKVNKWRQKYSGEYGRMILKQSLKIGCDDWERTRPRSGWAISLLA